MPFSSVSNAGLLALTQAWRLVLCVPVYDAKRRHTRSSNGTKAPKGGVKRHKEDIMSRNIFSIELTSHSRFELRMLIGSLSVQLAIIDPDAEERREVQESLHRVRRALAMRRPRRGR